MANAFTRVLTQETDYDSTSGAIVGPASLGAARLWEGNVAFGLDANVTAWAVKSSELDSGGVARTVVWASGDSPTANPVRFIASDTGVVWVETTGAAGRNNVVAHVLPVTGY